jgi:hypothetical protein
MSESFDPEDFFETVCSSIDDMRMLLQACEQEEECILEETATLEVEAAVATTARNAAKRHGELTASLTDVREEVGGIKANLGRLRDQRRSACRPTPTRVTVVPAASSRSAAATLLPRGPA